MAELRQSVKLPIVIALCVGLICLALIAIPVGRPKRIAENVVLNEVGLYESPRGTHFVNVSRVDDGRLKINVTWKNGGGGATAPFQPNSDWFICFDNVDRLWVYVPEQGHDVCHCWYTTHNSSGTRTAGALGGRARSSQVVPRTPSRISEGALCKSASSLSV